MCFARQGCNVIQQLGGEAEVTCVADDPDNVNGPKLEKNIPVGEKGPFGACGQTVGGGCTVQVGWAIMSCPKYIRLQLLPLSHHQDCMWCWV